MSESNPKFLCKNDVYYTNPDHNVQHHFEKSEIGYYVYKCNGNEESYFHIKPCGCIWKVCWCCHEHSAKNTCELIYQFAISTPRSKFLQLFYNGKNDDYTNAMFVMFADETLRYLNINVFLMKLK